MDDADRAEDKIEAAIADGIDACRHASSLPATGACYYCSEPVPVGYVFCCGECRTDWDYMQARRRAQGK